MSGNAVLAMAPALADVPSTLEGRTFGRYRLVKKIADGGQSEIYRAVAHGPQGFTRTFVVKRLKPELARVHGAGVPVHRRGPGAGQPGALQRRPGVRLRQPGQRVLHRPGVHRGPGRGAAVRPLRGGHRIPHAPAHRLPHRLRDAAGAALRPHPAGPRRAGAGHRPPRRLQHQRHGHLVGRREAVRLRHRQVQQPGHPHPGRHDQGQRPLHVPRTRPGPAGRRPQRRVQRRRWCCTSA